MDVTPRDLVASPLVRYGLVYPVPTLLGLFLASGIVGITYGDLVFLLTVPVAVFWVIAGLAGRRLAASMPAFELLFGTASAYGKEDPEETTERVSRGGALLVYLTGVVGLGWASLVATILFG